VGLSGKTPHTGETILKYGAPWILSGVGSYFGHSAWGNAAAFFLILSLCLWQPRRIKPVEVVLASAFLLFWLGANVQQVPWLIASQSYLAPSILAGLAFGSLVVGTPFTLAYAREWAPPEMWNNPHFYFVNRILTALWGSAFLLTALVKYWNGLPGIALTLLNLSIMFSVAYFTKWFPDWYRDNIYLKLADKEVVA
jgi:hypothetical protein